MQSNLENIYNWFEKAARTIVRLRWVFIFIVTVTLAVALFGLFNIKLDNSIEGWFFEGAEIKKANDAFEELFGNNDYVAFLIEADDIFQPKVLHMIRELGDELLSEVEFADTVVSLTDMEVSRTFGDEIITEKLVPDEIPEESGDIGAIRDLAYSKSFLVDRFFTADAKQTWVILTLLPFPDDWKGVYQATPSQLVGNKVLEILARSKYQDFSIKPTGMIIMDVEESQFFQTETSRLLLIALLLAIIILAVFLRSFRGVVVPIITTFGSIVVLFGFMGHLGIEVNASMMSMPILLGFAVSIGYSIHIFNFFKRRMVITGNRKESVYYAVRESGWPIFFTAMTTIGALISFSTISLVPILWLGLTSASLVFIVYISVMILTPILLSFGKNKTPKPVEDKDVLLWTDKYFNKLGGWVHKNSIPVVIGFFVIVIFFGWGLTKIEINVDYQRIYGDKIPYANRMFEISKSKIGSFYSYNVTLDFNEADKVKEPEVLKNVETFIHEVNNLKVTKKVSSLLSTIKDMHQLFNEDNPEFYTIPENKNLIAQLLLLYEMSGGTEAAQWVNYDYSTLRLMVEVGEMDYEEIRREMDYLRVLSNKLFPDAKISITGYLPVMIALTHYISIGQVKSFLVALVVIMFLMMLVFKSFKTGLIGLIPNITPAIIIGGAMGHLGIPLDFITVTMMPMILGLAVDDTIHFITHAHIEYNRHNDYQKAINKTLAITGRSLFMTSFIIIAAFTVYLSANMTAMFNFGVFIIIGIASALIADYLITPICLKYLKPFGKENEPEIYAPLDYETEHAPHN